MNKYGQAALTAVKLIENKQATSLVDVWEIAVKSIFDSKSSQDKSCPKGAFIGVCEAGLVRGIPQGNYAVRKNSQKNKAYAIRAVELLKANPVLAADKNMLWDAVMDGEVKQHNSQMDVVLALWEEGKIL